MTTGDLRKAFVQNLTRIMYERHKTQVDIVKDLGFKQPTVSAWMNGEKYPRIDKIQMLAEYLNVQVTDLVGKDANDVTVKYVKRTTNIEERYEYFIKELSLRNDEFQLDGIVLDDEDIDIIKSMLESYLSMVRNVIKSRHIK